MNKKDCKPLEIESDNPSQNSRLKAATKIQSSVRPKDYPAQDRADQVKAGTGENAKAPCDPQDRP